MCAIEYIAEEATWNILVVSIFLPLLPCVQQTKSSYCWYWGFSTTRGTSRDKGPNDLCIDLASPHMLSYIFMLEQIFLCIAGQQKFPSGNYINQLKWDWSKQMKEKLLFVLNETSQCKWSIWGIWALLESTCVSELNGFFGATASVWVLLLCEGERKEGWNREVSALGSKPSTFTLLSDDVSVMDFIQLS